LKFIKRILRLICATLFLPFWWLERLRPRNKNIFVFGAWHGKKYSDNSKALFEYILDNEPKIKPYWITHDKKIYNKLKNENKPVLMAYSLKGWLISLRASVAFTTTGENDINKYTLNGIKHIWLWHGMPLKKIRGDSKGYLYFSKEKRKLFVIKTILIKYLKPYSYFKNIVSATISSGNFFLPLLQSAFFLHEKNIWLTGLPRTDYFNKKTEKIIYSLRGKYAYSRIVLYMPTFRISSFSKKRDTPYNPFNLSSFKEKTFLEFLEKENIIFIYKPHFHDRDVTLSTSDRFILINDNDYDELYVLISNIDILVTDYSSVYFDFLCLNKPAILTPFDYDTYIKKSREHYFNYDLLPSIKAYNWNELMNIITEKRYYTLPKEETDKFCKYNDGHASERCLQKTLELLAGKT